MRLLKIIVASIFLLMSAGIAKAQVSSENLVNIHTLTATQISSLVSPAKGSLVFNSDSNKLYVFDGSAWIATASIDTTSLSNRINQRVRYTDTASMLIAYVRKGDTATMLAPYLRKVDTSSLSTRIDARVKYTDTAAMLTPYTRSANSMKYSDTAAMLVPYARTSKVLADSTALASNINLRVKYTDTATMLVPYLRKVDTSSLSTRIDARVKYTDTAAMLTPYTRSANSMKYSDTAAMLVPYLRKVDTASLSARIDSRLSYSDTATMLGSYLRKSKYQTDSTMFQGVLNGKLNTSDTASMLANYLNNASNGLTKSGKTVQLGGTLTSATTIANSGANTLRISGLASGDLNDSLVVVDPTTGELLRVSFNRLSKVDSTTASNGLTLTGKDVRLGGNLTAATTITNNANTLTIATGGTALNVTGLTSGALTDSLVTVNAGTGRINRIASSQLLKSDSTTASNGLTLTGKDVRLGGTLTSATTITNSGANTLRISGLASGDLNDSLVVADATTGELLRVSSARLSKVDSTTASNGLTLTGKDVRLGGNLTAATTITNNANTLTIATGGTALNVTGLTSGALTDSLVTVNAGTGRINRIASSQLLKSDSTTASNGLTLTGKDVRLGGTLTSATTIANSGANTLRISGLASGDLNDSLVVADATTGELLRVSSARLGKVDSTTASNGLTLTGKDVRLGGTLTAATTITNSGANTLRISGLASGDLNDSLVVADATTGELLRVSSARLSKVDSTTASNGLTLTGKDVRLGGNLTAATTITNNTNALTIATGGTAFNVTGLTSGALTDSLVTVNAGTGRINRIASSQLLKSDSTTASNGLTLTGKDVRLGGTLTAATTITNSGANTLRISGLASGDLNDSLVVADATTGELLRVSTARLSKSDSTTATNGLTLTGKDVRLGGNLTGATTVTTTATNTLAIAGLQTSSLNDSVLMISSGNVVRRINSSSVALEPFNVVGGTTKASTNTQDIYTQGNLSVGKAANAATLDVGGKVKADSTISAPNFSSTYQDFGSTGGAISWNMQSGSTAGIRLTSNGTITISNVTAGMYGLIRVTQDGTGGRTLTLPSGSRVINSGGSATVVLTQTANAVDILTFFYDGTNYWWTIGNNY
jgi:hypothetical protein